MSNSRTYDGAIQNVLSEEMKIDGVKYLENSKGFKINIYLNNKLIESGILTAFRNDIYGHCILMKIDEKSLKYPIPYKISIEDDEDMEFPTVYFDYRKKEVSDESLVEKEDEKSFEELAYKMAHGGPKKKNISDRYDQAILSFEIEKPKLS